MIVRCTNCDTAYAVDDKKIENKKFGFSCPKCGTGVIIDNRQKAVSEELDLESIPEYRAEETMPGREVSKKGAAGMEEFELPGDEEFEAAARELEETEISRRARKTGAKEEEFDFSEIEGVLETERKRKPAAEDELVQMEDEPLSLDDFESGLEHSGAAEELKPVEEEINFDEIIQDEIRPSRESRKAEKISPKERKGKPLGLRDDILLEEDIKTDEIFSKDSADVDESITIDLDSLDIELEETEGRKEGAAPEADDLEDLAAVMETGELPEIRVREDEDFDTTIDLDSLDITLDEVEELKKGVPIDEDERLTLEDTGLSIDELGEEAAKVTESEVFIEEGLEEEDIKLNLKEIDPRLSVEDLSDKAVVSDKLLTEDFETEKLPELDLDKFQTEEVFEEAAGLREAPAMRRSRPSEDFLDIEARDEFARYEEEGMETGDVVPGGAINFSIDYSLSYSRLGGIVRLLGLFSIGLLPHFVVFFLYSLLSMVVGVFNWVITLFTGYADEDFSDIQEKTLRYMISIIACSADVVEEMPVYTGKKDIDYSLQMNVIYPVRYSRFLALLRLSVVGIYIVMLPHILLLGLLTLGAGLIGLMGIISVIAIKKWPNVLFDYMVRYLGYVSNVCAFIMGIVDKYPSFRFE